MSPARVCQVGVERSLVRCLGILVFYDNATSVSPDVHEGDLVVLCVGRDRARGLDRIKPGVRVQGLSALVHTSLNLTLSVSYRLPFMYNCCHSGGRLPGGRGKRASWALELFHWHRESWAWREVLSYHPPAIGSPPCFLIFLLFPPTHQPILDTHLGSFSGLGWHIPDTHLGSFSCLGC